ncbi:MAG: hypothetical protein ACRDOG_10475 [Gaiellaceae bacterium]
MDSSDVATLVVSILSMLGAAGALYFTWQAKRTRIVGQINGAWVVPLDAGDEGLISALMLHTTLTNARSNPISITDYELRIDRGRGLEQLSRLKRIHRFPSFRLGESTIEMNWSELRIDFPPRQLEHGSPLWGFVVFYSREEIGEVERYILTALDSLGGRHDLESNTAALAQSYDMLTLLEASGARVVPAAQSSPSSPA